MIKKLFILLSIIHLSAALLAAKEPMSDYSFIRGICHSLSPDQETLERDLGFMERLQLNSTRVWFSQRVYERNPDEYINRVVNYVRTCNKHGVSVMPILFNGSFPQLLEQEAIEAGEKYVTAIVNALKNEEGLLMWDIMNEPRMNDYYRNAPPEEQEKRNNEITGVVRHFINYVREIDTVNAVTVGYWLPKFCENTADLVDVISFHDYLETRARVEESYALAEEISKKYNKPLINSELGAIGRSNPYDMALQICNDHKIGWYVFDLIVSGYWSDIQGLVYPDGTIRDPAAIAALYGFYRKRDLNTTIKIDLNRDKHPEKAIELLEKALGGNLDSLSDVYIIKPFETSGNSVEDILEAAEYCANLLEGAEMVPMWEPPTAKIETWRAMSAEEREKEKEEIRKFAFDLGLQLKKWCELF